MKKKKDSRPGKPQLPPLPFSAQDLPQMFNRIGDGIFALDVRWHYSYVNVKGAALLGKKPEDLIGKHIWTEFPEGVGQPFHRTLERAMQSQIPIVMENYYGPWDRWFENRVYPDPEGIIVFFTEITEKKLIEIELKRSEESLAMAQKMAHLGNWESDLRTGRAIWSDEFFRICGYEPGAFQPTVETGLSLIHPDDRERAAQQFNNAIEAGGQYDIEKRIVRPDGTIRWVHAIGFPVYDENNTVVKFVGTFHDITEQVLADEKLRRSEERFRKMADNISEGLTIIEHAEVTYVNARLCEIIGYPRDELMKMSGMDFAAPEEKERLQRIREEGRRTNTLPDDLTFWIIQKNGTRRCIRNRYSVLREGPVIVGRYVITTDVTEERRALVALHETNQRLQLFFDTTRDLISLADKNARTVWANRAWTQVFESDPAKGHDPFNYIHPSDREKVGQAWTALVTKNEELKNLEYRFLLPDETYGTFESSAFPVTIGNENLFYIVASNITERKLAEEALVASETRYEELANSITDIFFAMDEKLRYTFWNKASEELTGVPAHDALGKSLYDIFPGVRGTLAEESYLNVLRTRESVSFIDKYQIGENEKVFEISIYPFGGGLSVFTRDITERTLAEEARWRAEEALKETSNRLLKAQRVSHMGFLDWDLKTNEILVSDEICRLYGFRKDEIKTSPELLVKRVHPDDMEFVQKSLELARRGEQPYDIEHRIVRPDGSIIWTHSQAELFRDADGKPQTLIGTAVDITTRKLAELARRQSEVALRLQSEMLTNMSEGVNLVRARDSVIVYTNPRFSQMFGYDPGELIGKHISILNSPTERSPREVAKEISEILEKTGRWRGEVFNIRKDGASFWCYANISTFDHPEHGKVLISVQEDITERKLAEEASKRAEAELEKSRRELRMLARHLQNVREEERREIAREIHDDLGQQLTALKMDLSFLVGSPPANKIIPPTPDSNEWLSGILKLVDRSIGSVRSIASKLHPVLLDTLGLIPAMEWQVKDFKERAQIDCTLTVDQSAEPSDRDRSIALYRALQESLTNVARHAAATAVTVTFTQENDNLVLTVMDNGRGIDSGQLANIRGLGLIGMRERAMAFGGTLDITRASGGGTSVKVTIPKA